MLADMDLTPVTVSSYSLSSPIESSGGQGTHNQSSNYFSGSSQLLDNPGSPVSLTSDSPIPTFALSTGFAINFDESYLASTSLLPMSVNTVLMITKNLRK